MLASFVQLAIAADLMFRISSVRVVLLALLFPLCYLNAVPALAAEAGAGSGKRAAELAFTRATPLPSWVERIAELPPAPAGHALAVRLADTQFRIDSSSAYHVHRAFAANEVAGLAALGQYEIPFQPDYQKLELHTLRIVRGGRSIDKLDSADMRFLQRETSLDQGIYSGSVTVAIVIDDVRVGDTLELEYTVFGQNPVFGGKFFESANWDMPLPVAYRRVSVDAPEGRVIHARLAGGARGVPPVQSSTNRNGRRIERYEARAMLPTVQEPYVPSDVVDLRYLQLSEFAHWREVADWALGLFAGGDDRTSAALKEALAGVRAPRDKREALEQVLAFVQHEIRYLSISLGENSHRPYPPAQVLQRRYGDCKDKTLLMVALLRARDIEAAPVLVSTSQRKGLEKMLPSPLLFDHAIVRAVVDGQEYYLDPTRQGQYGSLAQLGQVHAGAQGLTIARGVDALAVIGPPRHPDLILSARLEQVTISALDQPAQMLVRRTYDSYGAEAMRMQLAALDKEQLRKAYEGVLGDRYPEAVLIGAPRVQDDRQRNRLVVETDYRIPNFLEEKEGGWQLRYQPTNLLELFHVPGNAPRAHPLSLPYGPGKAEYVLQLTLPEQFDARYDDQVNADEFGPVSLSETLSFKGRVFNATAAIRIGADRIPASGVVGFLAGMKKYNALLNGGLFISKSTLKSAATAPAAPARTRKQAIEANLAGATRLLAEAEQTGQDLAILLCERGLANAWLGQEGAALADGARLVKLHPQSGDAWRCRGEIDFVAAKFQDAENDFGRAIARGGSGSAPWLGKAVSGVYLGKLDSARADLRQASAKAEDAATRDQVRLWAAIVNWKAAAPVEDGAAGDPGWRDAARRMFEQDTGPDPMLRLASRNGGRELDARLAEAYFYAGKYYQLRQDKVRARVYFRRVLEKEMVDSMYHTAARHELTRLID